MWKFIFGILFGRVILPFFNILIDVFEIYGEKLKAKLSEDIAKSNKIVGKYSSECEDEPKRIIGFQLNDEPEEEFDDDEF